MIPGLSDPPHGLARHGVVQLPQCWLVLRSVSQPFAALPSQLPHSSSQNTEQVPPAQVAVPWPLAQAPLQHVPLTQTPDRHWVSPEHPAPVALFGRHMPTSHQRPDPQWTSLPQGPHVVPLALQFPFGHGCCWTGGQLPAPSQTAASVWMPFVHEAGRHCVDEL